MQKLAVVTVAMAFSANAAFAQNFSGNLGFTYSLPSESDARSVTEYFGGLEYAFNRSFSVGADLAGYSIEDSDNTIASSTLHLIYHLDESTSFGLFTGRDAEGTETDDGAAVFAININGLEAGTEFAAGEAEGYIGLVTSDDDDESITMFGASGQYDFADGFAAIGSADFLSGDDRSFRDLSVGVEYSITGGPELYGVLGQRSSDFDNAANDDTSSTYVEIGATVSFGNERGTTFDRRSTLRTVAGNAF